MDSPTIASPHLTTTKRAERVQHKMQLEQLKKERERMLRVLKISEQLVVNATEKTKNASNQSTRKWMETLAQASKQQGSKYQIEIADLEACIKEEQAALAKIASQPSLEKAVTTIIRRVNSFTASSCKDSPIERLKFMYYKAIHEKILVKIRAVRLNYVGLPRSGKTSFRRRLMGEIVNLFRVPKENPSTGVAEDAGHMIIRRLRQELGLITEANEWTKAENMCEVASWFNTLLSQHFMNDENEDGNPQTVDQQRPKLRRIPTCDHDNAEEIFRSFQEAMSTDSESFNNVCRELEDLTLLINTDTGGQSEFLDLHGALVNGPSLNLLFTRLTDQLDSQFKVHYTDKHGVSTEDEGSTVTTEEMIFQFLSSIACFGQPGEVLLEMGVSPDELPQSKVIFMGTHRDKVTEEAFREKDKLLQKKMEKTTFYSEKIIKFTAEDQLMIPVDNLNGGEEEIRDVQQILEKVVEENFPTVAIPASWLILILYIRNKRFRMLSLKECEEQALKLQIGPDELQTALWFFHHHMGALLYYPEVEELKETVICDIRVVYDCATNLIKNAFTFEKVGKWASKRFRERGQFSMADARKAMSDLTDNLIPIEKLVKLLAFLNILCLMNPSLPSPSETPRSSFDEDNEIYFMPCILKNATPDELVIKPVCPGDPAPLLIHYECGYVPIGIFPAMVTNLLSQKLAGWELFEDDIRKNKVQFLVGADCDTVTLISHPRFLEVGVTQVEEEGRQDTLASVCNYVRHVVESTLTAITDHMNYDFQMGFKYAFECPSHPGRDHVGVLAGSNPEKARFMKCAKNHKGMVPVAMRREHKVWFDETQVPQESPQVSLGALELLKWQENGRRRSLRLVHKVSSKWKLFGTLLGISEDRLDGWAHESHHNAEECWAKVMSHWLSKNGVDYPATWRGLFELLRDAEFSQVAEELKGVLKHIN